MRTTFKSVLAASAVAFASMASAAPVSLGSVEHFYGSDAGRVAPTISNVFHPMGNCDVLNATTLTVRARTASSCNRFGDNFDFSGIDFDTIDRFEITLNFSGARNQGILNSERWNVRGSYNYVQSATTFGSQLAASGPQTFVFASTAALFNDIVNAQNFMLAFSTNSGTATTFELASAKLELFGTAAVAEVPEPASLALLGLGLAGLAAVRRRKQA